MSKYQTPGVYVEEISTFPPSVAEVATAIPAFLGYTEKGVAGTAEAAQINTLLEFELRFGKAKPTSFVIGDDDEVSPSGPSQPERLLWYALSHYFKNGGGRCYVVSIGSHDEEPSITAFERGLAAIEREDEPTLIVMPEAVLLGQPDYNGVNQQALALCAKLADRFAILDVRAGEVAPFRE